MIDNKRLITGLLIGLATLGFSESSQHFMGSVVLNSWSWIVLGVGLFLLVYPYLFRTANKWLLLVLQNLGFGMFLISSDFLFGKYRAEYAVYYLVFAFMVFNFHHKLTDWIN